MIIDSDDYHDYVIKDGKLIGEFEQMYQKAKGTPWHQDRQEEWLDIRLEVEMLREYAPFDYICDFGCGTGHFLSILCSSLGSKNLIQTGLDISETACARAKELFPKGNFSTLDLMARPEVNIVDARADEIHPTDYQNALFSIRGTLWYVFPEMENVVKNIANRMRNNDLLLVTQNFPPLESKFVGKDVIPNPDAVVKWFSSCFHLKKHVGFRNFESSGNDNWFIWIFRK